MMSTRVKLVGALVVVGLLGYFLIYNPTRLNGTYQAIHPVDGTVRYLTIRGWKAASYIETPLTGRLLVSEHYVIRNGDELQFSEPIRYGSGWDLLDKTPVKDFSCTVEDGGETIVCRWRTQFLWAEISPTMRFRRL